MAPTLSVGPPTNPEPGHQYHVYAPEYYGKGLASEAVTLLVRYLFESKRVNRIRLVIHPDNAASRRIAEKCGFRHEGTARGAWYNQGRHQDVEIYAILHDEVIAPVGWLPVVIKVSRVEWPGHKVPDRGAISSLKRPAWKTGGL